MKKHRLAICDPEREYAYRLMDALGRRPNFPFEVFVCTGIETLEESLSQKPRPFLVIAQSVWDKSRGRWQGFGHLVLLGPEDVPEPGVVGISKYAGVSRIARKILEEAKKADFHFLSEGAGEAAVRFLGIYSPVRRCLQTTFSLCLGQLLARDHSVLYLNFECFSGLPQALGREFDADLSDLLYFLDEPGQDFLERLYQSAEKVNGLDVVAPALSGTDIRRTAAEEWIRLLETLRASRYEYVILDLSESVQGLPELLRRCSRIYTIVKEDGFALAKLEQYRTFLQKADYGDVLEQTKELMLPLLKRLPGDLNHLTLSELAKYIERMLKEDEAGRI